MFDKYANLYADIGARFAELSPIPRTVSQFFQRYQNRILYGTDMSPDAEMYRVTFRLLKARTNISIRPISTSATGRCTPGHCWMKC
jgi:hypothetical protein